MTEYAKERLAKMDKRTKRYRRTVLYRKGIDRLGVKKTAKYEPTRDDDYGLEPEMEIRSGFCPCSVCGHEFMWECEDADCQCCSSACT